jgi:two-component system response regulator MprA
VLIIEDDADVREALSDALAGSGLEVTLAHDGLDGLEKLERERPSLILLDLRMPRLGGEEFLARMRADARFDAVPVITMSAGSGRPQGEEVQAHLQKPFELEELTKLILTLV